MYVSFLIHSLYLLILTSCIQNASSSELTNSWQQNQTESYTLDFREYGFTLTSPCLMKDVSSQSNGDFLINYGGIINQNDPLKLEAYQLIVSRLPVGYKNLSKNDLESKVDNLLKSKMSNMKNLKPIRFGYEGYIGYVGETTHNGMKQKGVIFLKDNLTIALTVITNNNVDDRFNLFTNGFKSTRK